MKITSRVAYRIVRGSIWIATALGSVAICTVALSSSANASLLLFPVSLLRAEHVQQAPTMIAPRDNSGAVESWPDWTPPPEIIDGHGNLYCRVNIGTKLTVLPMTRHAYNLQEKRG
jgi:hypothetical protein